MKTRDPQSAPLDSHGFYSPLEWSRGLLAEFAEELCPGRPVDLGIVRAVKILSDAGFATFESCEGGPGHSYPEPTVRFHGTSSCGWKALGELMTYDLPIRRLSRTWTLDGVEPSGPYWEVTFLRKLV